MMPELQIHTALRKGVISHLTIKMTTVVVTALNNPPEASASTSVLTSHFTCSLVTSHVSV